MNKQVITAKQFLEMQKNGKIKTPKKKRNNSEHEIQKACVSWFKLQYKKHKRSLFAVPNGAKLYGNEKERAIQWNKLKAEGALPGVADLFLAVPSGKYAGLFLEMKTPRGSQSKVQYAFEMDMLAVGYGYAMPTSTDEFRRIVNSYLETGEY
jgi:hypothetical protein